MIYYCLGMPSSASTWTYNVVRSILKAAGVAHIAFRGETFGDFMNPDLVGATNAVIKGHRAETFLMPILQIAGIKAILSVRDPRDATTSLVQRFELNAGAAAMQMNRSVAAIISAADSLPHLAFYFEDRPSEHADTVAEIARFLEMPLSDGQIGDIFNRFKAEAVKEFIRNIDKLPPERHHSQGAGNAIDLDTQFHKTHITDMKVGKWSSFFDAETAGDLDRLFRSYAEFFAARGVGAGRETRHATEDMLFAPEFSGTLFRPVNDINAFRRQLNADEVIGEHGMLIVQHVYLPAGRWDLQLEVDVPVQPRFIRAKHWNKIVAEAPGTRMLRFEHQIPLSSLPVDFYVDFPGMRDMGAIPPPPAKVLARRIGG